MIEVPHDGEAQTDRAPAICLAIGLPYAPTPEGRAGLIETRSANRAQPPPELAVSVCDPRKLVSLAGAASLWPLLSALGWRERPYAEIPDDRPVARLYFGNEFCDRLIPSQRALRQMVEFAERANMALTLLTPMISDRRIGRLRQLLGSAPVGTEVVVNDVGVLRMLARDFADLVPVAGRQLIKAIKDPRLPSGRWARINPCQVGGAALRRLLHGLGVRRLEMDVPPFARAVDLDPDGMRLSLHGPCGYVAKGPICRIGSLHLSGPDKFAPGHRCRKECLSYACDLARPPLADTRDLRTFQRGNTVFYRHGPELNETLWDAFSQARADRLVIAGDWNEGRRTD